MGEKFKIQQKLIPKKSHAEFKFLQEMSSGFVKPVESEHFTDRSY